MSDTKKIERLFKDNWDALCMFSLHYVGDMDTAEDIVMDCFLKLSVRIGQGEGLTPDPYPKETVANPKQYLYQMVRNESLDKASHVSETIQLSETTKASDDIDDVAERSEREVRLWKAIDSLPPIRREVLLMSKRDRLKHEDIAAHLGISIKTVESHLYKAYKSLRSKAREIYTMIFF